MRQAFVDTIFELGKTDPRVVYLASDLQPEIFERMKREMPGRAHMCGVNEQAMIGMATGLALEGFVVWAHTIATFLTRRCFEQVALAAQQNLPIRLLANGGGLCYSHLGPSHLAIDDIALMRSIPNMTVIAPGDADEARELAFESMDVPGPVYFRVGWTQPRISVLPAHIGEANKLAVPDEAFNARVLMISTGSITAQVIEASAQLGAAGIPVRVLHCHTVKPIDLDVILRAAQGVDLIAAIEEHSIIGGLRSAIADAIAVRETGVRYCLCDGKPRLISIGIPDIWPDRYGTRDDLLRLYGLQPDQIAERIKRELCA